MLTALRFTLGSLLLLASKSLAWTAPPASKCLTSTGKSLSLTHPKLTTKNTVYQNRIDHATTGRQHLSSLPPLQLSSSPSDEKKLPMLLDPGTKGGALFLSLVLFVVPIVFYQAVTNLFGIDEIEAGKWIGVGFTVVTLLVWASTYIFRVATKDMTYAKQLKDYEDAVIAKRLEELDEDEVQALVEDIERDNF